nr:PQQ-binding-like beta-propeller repeat protein [Acidimicrobiia bacterium]
ADQNVGRSIERHLGEVAVRQRAVIAAIASALLMTGCGALGDSLGGSVGPNEWTLIGATPDERHLLITTLFGGVASDCTRWEGWEVNETSEQVEIRALIWEKRFPDACTDDGAVETFEVSLTEPLGDRELVGCERQDCRTGEPPDWLAPYIETTVTSTGQAVVARDGATFVVETASGNVLDQPTYPGPLLGSSNGVDIVWDGRQTIALDPPTGAEIWSDEGYMAGLGGDKVLLCRGNDSETIVAVTASDGAEVWSTYGPCELTAVGEELITIVAHDRAVDGGHELVLLDASTGEQLVRRVLDDGSDDQVAGFDGIVAAGDRVVVSGQQANLVILGRNGEELVRGPSGQGTPIGFARGVVVLAGYATTRGVDPSTGETLWSSSEFAPPDVQVAGDAVWRLDSNEGTVSRLDPRTGEAEWSASVGISHSSAVAVDEDTAYVATPLALIALDATAGDRLWWQHLPYRAAPAE